jgi:hypothetical protein
MDPRLRGNVMPCASHACECMCVSMGFLACLRTMWGPLSRAGCIGPWVPAQITKEQGVSGLFKGIVPRVGLGIWQTLCMVTGAKMVQELLGVGVKH